MRTYEQLEKRSLALHRLIASKIEADPTRLDIPRANIRRWETNGTVQPDHPLLAVWMQAIDKGVAATVALLLDTSERGNELRQAAPFAGVLTIRERSDFFRQWALNFLE